MSATTRRLQVRDAHDPIAALVRDWAARNDVPALRYADLIEALQAEMDGLIRRAQTEAYQDGMAEGVRTLKETLDVGAAIRGGAER